jgi:hypothetical protein
MLSGDEFPQIDKNSNIQRNDLVGQFVELVLASLLRKKTAIRTVSKWSYVQQATPARDQRPSVCRKWSVIRWNKFRQIFISYHLATGECPFSFRSDERTSGCFNSLPSSHSYPAYEMKQISASFHLISRLSSSRPPRHFYKSH